MEARNELRKLYPFEFILAERSGHQIKAKFLAPVCFRLEVAK
jgi:hypothetical protein